MDKFDLYKGEIDGPAFVRLNDVIIMLVLILTQGVGLRLRLVRTEDSF